MFCPKCKSMMISSGGQLKCRRCGYIQPIENDLNLKRTRLASDRTITIIDDEKSVATLPTCNTKCPKCEYHTAFWWLRQLRAADESEVRFYRCCQCNHTWREYD